MPSRGPKPAQVAAALVLALYWGALTLGGQFAIELPGVVDELWYSAAPGIAGVALAFAAGLYVGRWWLLIVTGTALLVLGVLELAGHRSPWHDSGPPLTQYGVWPLLSSIFWFFVVPIALGVAVRSGLGERRVGAALRR